MTASYVTLTLDLYDGAGNPFVKGSATFTPSMAFPDTADQMLVEMAPVTAVFRAGALPAVRLIANDTAGPQGASNPGWTWNVTYSSDTPGNPAAASYYVLSTNGSAQRLSQLAQMPAAQPGSVYLAVQGTPEPGSVPVYQPGGTAQWSAAVFVPPATGVAATDTANWQAALNAAAGGILVVPPTATQWVVNGNLKVPGGTVIQGSGWPSVPPVKLAASSGASCVLGSAGYLNNATVSDNPVTIRDLSIDVNGASNANCHGIVFMSYRSRIEHCYVKNPSLCGIVQADCNSAGTPISPASQVENVITRNTVEWTSPATVSGQYGIWVRDVAGGANTDGYLEGNIVAGPGDYAIRNERSAGWFISHNHVYGCRQGGVFLDNFWDTFYHDNEVDVFGLAGGAVTYHGHHVQNIISGREGAVHDNQCSTSELSAAAYVYYFMRAPAVTVGLVFHDNFAVRDSGSGTSSTAYQFQCSSSGSLTVFGSGNHSDGQPTALVAGGGGAVTFADVQPGSSLGGDAVSSGTEVMDWGDVTSQQVQFHSGDLALVYFTAAQGGTVTQVLCDTGNATPSGITYSAVGLYSANADGSLTLLASSANDTSLFAASYTSYAKAFSAPYQLASGARYALGILVVASGTMPAYYGNPQVNGSRGYSNQPRKIATVTGQSVLPSTISGGAPVATRATPVYAQVTP